MASPTPAVDLSWPALIPLFQQYWASEPAFSEDTLEAIRSGGTGLSTQQDSPLTRTFSLPEIDGDPHALLDHANFITNLPVDEVREQLQPAFRLASHLLTNEVSLRWFSYVISSSLGFRDAGPPVLSRSSLPVGPDIIQLIKEELVLLAGHLKFCWFSRLSDEVPNEALSGQTFGRTSSIVDSIDPLRLMTTDPLDIDDSNNVFCPSIFLNVEYFHQALRHRYHNIPRALQRSMDLTFAITIVHELAHGWVQHYHPATIRGIDPLIFLADEIPEAGYSCEKYILDASIMPPRPHAPDHIITCSFASLYCDPRHYIGLYVPVAWVDQWFHKTTWYNFKWLHTSVLMYVPTVNRQRSTYHFEVDRCCTILTKMVTVTDVDGILRGRLCCDDENYAAHEPGVRMRWPTDSLMLRKSYLLVMANDQQAAEDCGVDFFGSDSYDDLVELMRLHTSPSP